MSEEIRVSAQDVSYTYDEAPAPALNNVSLDVRPGEFVAVLGHNGSGKSTLAKLCNALYQPTSGKLIVCGMDTADEAHLWDIRQHAGMVFQNPDNQIVASIVREDVAFGLENMGVPTDEMIPRIDAALAAVHMTDFAARSPSTLSGGQKQRIAIAGVLAMQPDVLIADEATAMLDPTGRKEVLDTVRKLNRDKGITVLWITHYMEEAALADRVVVVSDGQVVRTGTPKEVFQNVEALRALHLDVPPMAELDKELIDAGIPLPAGILTVEEMAQEVDRLCSSK